MMIDKFLNVNIFTSPFDDAGQSPEDLILVLNKEARAEKNEIFMISHEVITIHEK